ncbi:MAG: hypothetical protein M3P51_02395 [Chloroflexota bacterium]|nr:hypothetical protein [Chloroflexota bacterium]
MSEEEAVMVLAEEDFSRQVPQDGRFAFANAVYGFGCGHVWIPLDANDFDDDTTTCPVCGKCVGPAGLSVGLQVTEGER